MSLTAGTAARAVPDLATNTPNTAAAITNGITSLCHRVRIDNKLAITASQAPSSETIA